MITASRLLKYVHMNKTKLPYNNILRYSVSKIQLLYGVKYQVPGKDANYSMITVCDKLQCPSAYMYL